MRGSMIPASYPTNKKIEATEHAEHDLGITTAACQTFIGGLCGSFNAAPAQILRGVRRSLRAQIPLPVFFFLLVFRFHMRSVGFVGPPLRDFNVTSAHRFCAVFVQPRLCAYHGRCFFFACIYVPQVFGYSRLAQDQL